MEVQAVDLLLSILVVYGKERGLVGFAGPLAHTAIVPQKGCKMATMQYPWFSGSSTSRSNKV